MPNSYSSNQRGQVEGAAPEFNANSLMAAALVVTGLFLGREVLVPFVVAVLLSFVLAIPVRVLQGWGLGRAIPVTIVVLLAFVAIFAVAAVLVSQISELAADLPRYQVTIREKIASLKGAASGSGLLERLAAMLQSLSDELAGRVAEPGPGTSGAGAPSGSPAREQPLPVEIINTRTSPLSAIASVIGPLLHPLATAGLVAVFTVFALLQREDLRNRAIRLAGSHDLQRTTAAMNDAARRLSRLFLAQVIVNSLFGVVVGIGLWLIGVPSPMLWGILAAISRFVPYVGVVLAAGGPLILAAAVDPHWTMLIFTAAFFAVCEFMVGQIVEPLTYGHSTGLSPIAVIAAVTFWTWIWGPVGLILAVPLTVCVVVLGRHVDRLAFLDVMLGDRPPLTVAESFYQRVLAGDAGEAIEQAETFLRDHALSTYYDEVVIKGLALAQTDFERGALDETRLERISGTMAQLFEELADREPDQGGAEATKRAEPRRAAGDEDLDENLAQTDARAQDLPRLAPEDLAPGWRDGIPVLCLAGRNELDKAGAAMLAQVLEAQGLAARVEGAAALTQGGVDLLTAPTPKLVCLSYLDTSSPVHVRYAVRRLRRRLPAQVRIVVASWGLSTGEADGLCHASRSDGCASTVVAAARLCLDAARQDAPAPGPRQAEREAAPA